MTASLGFTYIDDLVREVNQRVRQAPKAAVRNAFRWACRELCRQSQWYGVNIDGVLDTTTSVYDINLGTQLESLNIDSVQLQPLPLQPGNNPVPLTRGDPSQFIPDNTAGQPVYFGYLPEGAFCFERAPDQAYPVIVRVLCQPTLDAVEIPTALTVKWQSALEAGALSFLYGLTGEAWADKQKEDRYARIFTGKWGDAKADKNRGYVAGSVRATPRPFVTRGWNWRSS